MVQRQRKANVAEGDAESARNILQNPAVPRDTLRMLPEFLCRAAEVLAPMIGLALGIQIWLVAGITDIRKADSIIPVR